MIKRLLKILVFLILFYIIQLFIFICTNRTNELVLIARMDGYQRQRTGDYLSPLFVSSSNRFWLKYFQPITDIIDQGATIAERSNSIDMEIINAVNRDFKQIVLVAAGFSTYSYRFNLFQDVQFYELDFPSVLDSKKKILVSNGVNLTQNIHYIGLDLNDHCDLIALFSKKYPNIIDFDKPTLFILEGITMYLKSDINYCLFKSIADWRSSTRAVFDIMIVNFKKNLFTTIFEYIYLILLKYSIGEPMAFKLPAIEVEGWLKNVSSKFIVEEVKRDVKLNNLGNYLFKLEKSN